jgi:peptidoglycan/xylan/chitin deacetylase (PgdA/CDA1 family)
MKKFCVLIAIMVLFCSCGTAHSSRGSLTVPSIPLVTFMFDDGDDTDYLVGRELFLKQGAVACSAITTDFINTVDHLNAAQIKALQNSGWEIMSHTASHPNLTSRDPDEIKKELSQSKASLESLGVTVNNLVYPYNKNSEIVRKIAARHYRAARGGTNSFNASPIDPYFLKSFSIKHDISRMKEHIDRAYTDKSWLIFYQHEIDIQVKLSDKEGTFLKGELLNFSPSGATARFVTVHWFPFYDFSLYLVPFSGTPQAGDMITGTKSGATARIDHVIYDDVAQLTEMIKYIQTRYPDMRIVTVDQGLDLLGVPKFKAPAK